ncbi:lipopolysaccharide biosynthesis protein [Microbacterium sp.]|uniref:lipopolysaccharide biosynthesis protein n=1 Tax=Microbacterium sp. TaxID=51671 RepID=UPI003A8E5CAA
MRKRTIRLASTSLRFTALAARFLLIFALAMFLPPTEVGLYGLVAATATYAVYALGMDFYTYSTREILESDRSTWRTKLTSHAAILGTIALIATPVFIGIGISTLLPWSIVGWLATIAISEQWAQDIDRTLIALSKQFAASVVILVRQAAMPLTVVIMFAASSDLRKIEWVFGSWTVFNVVAIILGLLFLHHTTPRGRLRVDWAWVRKGLVVALPFLGGTLLLRLLFTLDRQIVAYFDGLDVLGAYVLAVTISGGLSSVIAVGIMQFNYPSLITAAREKSYIDFRQIMRSITWQTTIVSGAAVLTAIVSHSWISTWFGQNVYVEYSWAIPASMIASALYNISLIPHYGLYAFHKDRTIFASTAISVSMFIACLAVLISLTNNSVLSVIVALCVANTTLLVVKYATYTRSRRAWAR